MAEDTDKKAENPLADYEKALLDGYFKISNGQKCLKPEFVTEYPQQLADELSNASINKLSQIWRFYDHARRIQDRVIHNGETFASVNADLQFLKPVVYNALNKETVTEVFKKFIDNNLDQIKNEDDLAAFIKHFQALIAYLPRDIQK